MHSDSNIVQEANVKHQASYHLSWLPCKGPDDLHIKEELSVMTVAPFAQKRFSRVNEFMMKRCHTETLEI